ncbi:MAG TPA: hypothetical protein VF631_07430 [Allosphingosinicella sp.]|jgi:hypothetical protein|uniref:hypothetical protein n=1 Tax=Allosphingosinicella sp. TaxID=2823234 RepID=UPI002F2816DE
MSYGISALRVIGALGISFLFIVMLMTAVAQQGVLARLEKAQLTDGYSSALGMLKDVDERRRALPGLIEQERELLGRQADQRYKLRTAEDEFSASWESFVPIARRLERGGLCDLKLPPEPELANYARQLAVWNEVQQCFSEGRMPPAVSSQFETLTKGEGALPPRYRLLSELSGAGARTDGELASVQNALKQARAQSEDELKARRSFSETEVLGTWLLGGGVLIAFPPPMFQILLAFTSGAFGALLVTLVLIVYPNNQINISHSGTPATRTLLGGLIAVCVYIILLGGSAVLGAADAFDEAGANYMTYCAVGVLAGMFSDRVAFWLSDRANVFFQRDRSGADPHPAQAQPAP